MEDVMKKILIILGLMIAIGVVMQPIHQSNTSYAGAGCCKKITSNETWRVINRNYRKCQDFNRRYDGGDDIYRRAGTYWWDNNCQ